MDTPGLFTAFGILMIGAIIVSGVVAIKLLLAGDPAGAFGFGEFGRQKR